MTATQLIIQDTTAPADVDGLIAVIGDLTTLLSAESEALADRQPARIADLGARKEQLALAYSDRVKALRAEPSTLRAADASTRGRLEAVAERFHAVLSENLTALSVAKRAHESLASAIGRAVAKNETTTRGYSDHGSYRGAEAAASSTVPVAIDRQI